MSRTCVYLSAADHAVLKRLCAALERTPSWVVRVMLRRFSEQLLADYRSSALPGSVADEA